ncbi:hypothetical protein [Bacillus haynesii]|uniref:hypothetical protein n=1 Tax=Bacillus haynesii TaxID=1925021 RepID=UPI001F618766|nr:hypothetical protein [Bacillus haynesii]MCI4129715.1 hypothetical protein [Bacillus haynesii]
MLKLNEKVIFRRLPEETRHHLIILVDRDEKVSMCILNIIMLDALLLFLLLANGIKPFTIVALPPLILVNLWMFILFFKDMELHRNNLEFVLYKGFSFSTMSFCWFILSQKMYYSILGLNWLFIIFSVLFLVIVALGSFRYYLIKFSIHKQKKRAVPTWAVYLLAAGPAAGYMISQITLHFSESVINIFMSIVSLLAACLFSFIGAKFIHQFLFVKTNQNIIKNIGKGRK